MKTNNATNTATATAIATESLASICLTALYEQDGINTQVDAFRALQEGDDFSQIARELYVTFEALDGLELDDIESALQEIYNDIYADLCAPEYLEFKGFDADTAEDALELAIAGLKKLVDGYEIHDFEGSGASVVEDRQGFLATVAVWAGRPSDYNSDFTTGDFESLESWADAWETEWTDVECEKIDLEGHESALAEWLGSNDETNEEILAALASADIVNEAFSDISGNCSDDKKYDRDLMAEAVENLRDAYERAEG